MEDNLNPTAFFKVIIWLSYSTVRANLSQRFSNHHSVPLIDVVKTAGVKTRPGDLVMPDPFG